ncbi:MAG: hypothetical protein FWC96_05595 [Oscillospiraceae bacterium]|nr:hypothetical protein [Oscillospiraceae bacterium]
MKKLFLAIAVLVLSTAVYIIMQTRGADDISGTVTLSTEFASYPIGTTEIRVFWKNDGVTNITFGDAFALEKQVEGIWTYVTSTIEFPHVGYLVFPGTVVEHIYGFRPLYDEDNNRIVITPITWYTLSNNVTLTEGHYRILTDYLVREGAYYVSIVIYATFAVSPHSTHP